MNRRLLLALGLTIAVLASVSGTGAFSSMNAGRSVDVAVVDDDEAYLGITGDDASNGRWNVTLTNRLDDGMTLYVKVEVDGQAKTATLFSGESETVLLTGVDCGEQAEVSAEATDDSVTIEASRQVTCDSSETTST